MTTPIRMTPWATVARLVLMLQERHVGPDQREDDDRHDRAEHAAPAAGQADAAEHDRSDAQQRVGPGHRRADAGAGREAQARRARRTAPSGRRRRPWSGRPTRRFGTPPAGCCRSRTATGPSRDRLIGIQITATTTISTTAALGIHSLPTDPITRSLSHLAEPPPGRVAARAGRSRPTRTTSPA